MGKYEQISRATWTLEHPTFQALALPVHEVYQHHTAGPFMGSYDQRMMRNLEAAEIGRGGYVALAYHQIIAGDGDQIESRPANVKGGATLNKNSVSVAICLPGNYEHDQGTMYQYDSISDVLVAWRLYGVLADDFTYHGHWEVFPTACPGANTKAWVGRMRHEADVKWAALHGTPQPTPPPPTPVPPVDWKALWKYRATIVLGELRDQQARGVVYGYDPKHSLPDVKVWQEACNLTLKSALETDGYFGGATRKVTTDYQKFFGLVADGVVGNKTRGHLIAQLAAQLAKA